MSLRVGFTLMVLLAMGSSISPAQGEVFAITEDFSDLHSRWAKMGGPSRVQQGRLQLMPGANSVTVVDAGYAYASSKAGIDAIFGTPVRGPCDAGLIFWATSKDEFYILWCNSSGTFGASKSTDGTLVVLRSGFSSAVHQGKGAINRLEVSLEGRTATLFINGANLGTLTCDREIGMRCFGMLADQGDLVEFDNLEIRPIASGSPAQADPRPASSVPVAAPPATVDSLSEPAATLPAAQHADTAVNTSSGDDERDFIRRVEAFYVQNLAGKHR